ncbi:hypothetical protein ACIQI7_30765 [Kitasatospora sp. NPDC092039]|uniref:hypothetical protein n=1 Tax=Kitasatospora sp. NPDC092039 TaxID=3364086 RepID=UPI003800B64A
MNAPDVVPISHRPDYRTDTIGRWQGGQFFASAVCLGVGRYYAVLHRFDDAGRHLDSRIRPAGDAVEAKRLLAEELDALPGREYRDIAIAPFAVHVDGELFGLVREDYEPDDEDESDDEGEQDDEGEEAEKDREIEEDEEAEDDERIHFELYPDGLGFDAPWCGCYDT